MSEPDEVLQLARIDENILHSRKRIIITAM